MSGPQLCSFCSTDAWISMKRDRDDARARAEEAEAKLAKAQGFGDWASAQAERAIERAEEAEAALKTATETGQAGIDRILNLEAALAERDAEVAALRQRVSELEALGGVACPDAPNDPCEVCGASVRDGVCLAGNPEALRLSREVAALEADRGRLRSSLQDVETNALHHPSCIGTALRGRCDCFKSRCRAALAGTPQEGSDAE